MLYRLRQLVLHLREMKYYVLWAGILFSIGTVIGVESSFLNDFIEGQVSGLGEVAELLVDSGPFSVFLFIFLNNAIKSVAVVFLGALFGLIPVFFLVVNGMVLGSVLQGVGEAGADVWLIVLKGILPHGIIELPAIIIACAYGLRLGVIVLALVFRVLFRTNGNGGNHGKAEHAWRFEGGGSAEGVGGAGRAEGSGKDEGVQRFFRMTAVLLPVLVVALLIAAVIESTLTFWLVKG